ncbi:MAG: prolyl oligopeptidase family serine peptidase [Bacteroidales bacterium]|nr:prolyl oligopeptidase family serine peptidase [Bacteroidales bacterium]MDD3913586.1 prolyl oligopeptidase family serine peptidase [Bacteroidales bacterium]MDD4633646.1 prolyl oligopeptidase family serine peptidase [Bacteroidales bacterium]
MKKINLSLILIVIIMISCTTKEKRPDYPVTMKQDVVDDYFGTQVADPYRWLENDTSVQTAEWVKEQNEVTFKYLDKIPFREKMKERLTAQWDYPKSSAPFKDNGRWMIYKNTGLQNQSVLYLLKDMYDREGEILLDPNTLSADGTVALSDIAVSKDGKSLIYSISRGGSDWNEFYVMDIDTRKLYDDHIMWVKFSGISAFNDGFFYSRYPQPIEGDELKGANENCMAYFHKIGTPQSQDELVYSEPNDPNRSFSISPTEDGKYLFLYTSESTTGNALAFKKVDDAKFTPVIENCEKDYYLVNVIDGKFYIFTNDDAPKYRLIAIDPAKPAKKYWQEIIPENDYVLQNVSALNKHLFANYLKDAHSVIQVFDFAGNYKYNVDAGIGSISGFNGELEDDAVFFSITSFNVPSIIYLYNVSKNIYKEYSRSKIQFNPDEYTTTQVFFNSKDGTKIPMFLTYKKGIELDGNNPTLLYGYGGFNISITPGFSISRLPLLENGGVLAVVNLRGGGEYGEEWHKAGIIMHKQNVFDDCIAAAEYLIDNKYTSPQHLALQGGSNGGLLVGAVVNQRPDLFAVALPAVGVMDMLRYHKFTIGRYWASDYGTSEDSKEMFEYLYAYSPLHTIKSDVEYPAVLVTTGDHDDRVVPAHSFKYAATLQEKYQGNHPTLIRIETQAGHGAGKPTTKIIDEIVDEWAFMFYNMGVEPACE